MAFRFTQSLSRIMKVKIIKEFNLSDTKTLAEGKELEVSNEFGERMIKDGFAEEAKEVKVKIVPRVLSPEVKEEKKDKKVKDKE